MSQRVPLQPPLPADMDAALRQALSDAFRTHALQLNWATAYDTINVSSAETAFADLVLADASGGGFTLTLPEAGFWNDRVLRIKKTDATGNTVTVATAGSETIDGAASVAISTQYHCRQFMSDGLNWHIVGAYP
jgi:hypothetical protein